MNRRITTVIMMLFIIPLISYANDSDRIDALEQQIQELRIRVSELELAILRKNDDKGYSNLEDGWKSKTNWRMLTTGMSTNDVEDILGEPQRVDGGNVMAWYYENSGRVIFIEKRVSGWSEPRFPVK